MSQKAQQFVDDWIDTHIHAEGYQPEGDNSEAAMRAEQCRAMAEIQGISHSEIEESVGDLVGYMADAIERANDAEIQRLSAKDD
ncbi:MULTISPECIES: DUF768 domain-containing protein [Methylobacterium]|uniref:DUF768 domain-containing protein n=2 Tax=Methylobacterium TaxID=407 RepID=A0A0C6FL54_9HYPH|nr:DUF768 domain-containing protein [Methylobacterium aquaticum]QRE77156.1 DUF768 domain-containing protein [Methylobacterium aquaticum]BAQ45884.1 hypothetical protein Maq22A_c13325 [Methylobacterium aquaticum]